MATATTCSPARDLADLRERLEDLEGELSRMPVFKNGTPWHTDRLRARDYLRRAIAGLEAELRK